MRTGIASDCHRRATCQCIWALGLVLVASSSFAEAPTGAPRIFRCQVNGQTTFSDRPCATAQGLEVSSVEVVLSHINSYRADAVPSTATHYAKPAARSESSVKQSESIAAEQQREQQKCQRLDDQIDTIKVKMRSGYTAKQGEQLRERQRQLEQRRRTERCR